jgi:hypothetical protein
MEKLALYDNFKEILGDHSTAEHIFIGEINTRGLAVGFHHEGELADGKSHVVESSRIEEDSIGIYEANVIIYGKRKNGQSSFFPKFYTPTDVLESLKDAYNRKKKLKYRLYESILSNGMIIHFYQSDDSDLGKITTAYPKYQK